MRTLPVNPKKRLPLTVRRRRRVIFTGALLIIAFAASASALAFAANIPDLQIREVRVIGAITVPENIVASIAENAISGNYFFLFPKRNALIYPRSSVRSLILGSLPVIRGVEMTREGFQSLIVSILEREPEGLWCRGASADFNTEVSGDADCYFLDDSGIIYARSPAFSNESFVTFGGSVASSTDALRAAYLPENTFSDLSFLIQSLQSYDFTPSYVYYEENGDFTLGYKGGLKIYLPGGASLSGAFANLLLIIKERTLPGAPDKIPNTLRYIDLRSGDKIFYK